MNIRTEQVEALLKQQEMAARKPTPVKGEGFGATLAQQVGLAGTENNALVAVPPPGLQSGIISQLHLAGAEKIADSAADATSHAFDQASGALDMWDSYISALGKPDTEKNLRDAYALLQGVDAKVSALKQEAQPVLGQNPHLASIVNELDVLTATEKFKFNRGDYRPEQ